LGEDMTLLAEKRKEVEKDLQEFKEENDINSFDTFLKTEEGTVEAENLKSLLEAQRHYSGAKLVEASVDFDENGNMSIQSPETDATSLQDYLKYEEQVNVTPFNFAQAVADKKVLPYNTIKVTGEDGSSYKVLDETELKEAFDVNILGSNSSKQKRIFKRWYRETYDGSDTDAENMWQSARKRSTSEAYTPTLQRYYDAIVTNIKSALPSASKAGQESQGTGSSSALPGSSFKTDLFYSGGKDKKGSVKIPFQNINRGQQKEAGPLSPVKTEGSVEVPFNIRKRIGEKAIALEEGKHKVTVNENVFLEKPGETNEAVDASVEQLFRSKDGDEYFAILKGLREGGRDLYSREIVKLNEPQIAAIKESLGSKVKEIGFDRWFDNVAGEQETQTKQQAEDGGWNENDPI